MIITIGGNPGAGKTTLANRLAETLGYGQLYMGAIFREMAAERGLTIEQFYPLLKDDPSAEQAADRRQESMMRERNNLIVQGRVAWYFAKGSPFRTFNILLTVTPQVGAARIAGEKENAGRSVREVAAATAKREQTEREHYAALYHIQDHLDPGHYDFVLDTTSLTEEDVAKQVLAALRAS